MKLSDYKIEKSFTSTNGDCYIATSKLDGKKYFIKRNTDVTYGSNSDSVLLRKKYKKDADEWLRYHNLIRKEFTKLGNGTGNTVFPIAYFIDNGGIYEIAHFVSIQPIDVSNLKNFSNDDKISIIRTSSYALMSIHSLNIIHCDLKPDNIPISKSELGVYVSKITDCGDAIFCNDIPEEKNIVCTEPYWSPELAAYKMGNVKVKNRLSCKSDVFAMGLIFHEWWTGDFPNYEGRDDFVSLYQVVHKSWPNKIKIDPSVPEWLATLIMDMLYPEPEKRPSMNEVFEAIKSKSYISSIPRCISKDSAKNQNDVSYEVLQKAVARIPKEDTNNRYTQESLNYLKELAQFTRTNFEKLSQKQVNILAEKINSAVDSLVIKPVEDNFKKIDDAIAIIESKDLSRFTSSSREKLAKIIEFAKKQKGVLSDENNINRLYSALASAYKALIPRTDFSIEAINPLPAPYTKVEILSDDYILAYYGKDGKIKILADNAIKMKLIKRK